MIHRILFGALVAWSAAAPVAAYGAGKGKDEEAIPYGNDDDEGDSKPSHPRDRPRRSEPTRVAPEETDVEKDDREKSLAELDDPNTGLAGEFVAGAMLVDSSRSQWWEARFGGGLRFTWELGRVLPGAFFREALFADVTWQYMGMRDGTQLVYGDSNYHYFTIAPAYAFQLWRDSDFYVYGQLGGGLAYEYSVLHNGTTPELPVSGLKPLIQYGIGFRGRPLISEDGVLRVSFRFELTRFRRQYMDDTFLGGSVGLAF
ncbi:MAG TPA: hypothetical protein VFA20_21790 [Myxococcaceae bacterium]|nr:hypothetical protein [Myxococcaceae bacterium]